MKTILLIIATILLLNKIAQSQELNQTIKGRVVDADTNQPLPGVNVILSEFSPPMGTITDMDGYYTLTAIPLGRLTIEFHYLGYETGIFKELDIRSSRVFLLNVSLKESYKQLNEVVVKPQFRKDKAQNNMANLSARSFSVEEATRFAGGWNDPSRLAGSFAGVTMAEGVNDNAIVIRGNAPKGILWRLEGVEIPAPNHLNGVNNGGGIETVFSVNMLDNSDFYTGAFPSEFGNAMSGVFDMNFRVGSNEKIRGTFQIGTQGIDVGSEGPLKKGGKASFLFNYRYSTMGLADKFLDGNFGLPAYQDLSYKLHLPTSGAGVFSIWGISGLSKVRFDPDEDISEWTNTFDNNQYSTGSDITVSGVSHQINIGIQTYIKSALAVSYDRFAMKSNLWKRDLAILPLANHTEDNLRLLFCTSINHKFGNRHTNQTGIRYTSTRYNILVYGNPDPSHRSILTLLSDQSGGMDQTQFFSQSKWRLTSTVDLYGGFNASYFNMNNEFIIEPRISATWRFAPYHSLSMAYGKHSRPEPLRFYEAQDAQNQLLNPELKVTKANHYVVGYDFQVSSNLKLKIEGYYQKLYDVPVISGDSYSLLNYQWNDYFNNALTNQGTGTNVGLDITLERYMMNGYYYMGTASIFDSKYIGGDGIERNTSFNRNYVINFLGGKEWKVGNHNFLGLSGKSSLMGGNRFTPPNQENSKEHEMVILDEDKAFEWQEDPRFFIDLAISYKVNGLKVAHIITLQTKNLLAQKEMFGWAYDFEKQMVVKYGLAMIYPWFTYRIDF